MKENKKIYTSLVEGVMMSNYTNWTRKQFVKYAWFIFTSSILILTIILTYNIN